MYHKLSRRFKQFGVAHSYLLVVFLAGIFTFTSAYALNFPTYITIPLEKVGEFFSIASTGETTTGNVGLGCDCDQNIYDYCQGTTVTAPLGDSVITYTFSEVVYCDAFGEGAYTPNMGITPVIAGTQVSIVNTTPVLTGSGDSLRNGFDVNPITYDSNTLDGRLGGTAAREYPFTIDTGKDKITSIIKAHSRTDTSDCRDESSRYARGCFEQLNILTVLDEMPDGGLGGYLRPAYYGGSETKTLRSRSSIDLARLPNIGAQTRGNPATAITMDQDIENVLPTLASMKVGWQREYIATERFKGYENFNKVGTGYSPDALGQFWLGAHFLYLDPNEYDFTQAQKEELAYGIVEHGLDVIQIVLNYPRGDGPWPPNGGHSTGRYGFAAVALALLNDGGTLAAQFSAKVNGSDLGEQSFAETGQITQGDNGYSIYGIRSVAGGKTSQACEGSVNQLPRHDLGLVDNGRFNGVGGNCTHGAFGAYQHIASLIFVQQGIVCSMIPACKAIADNEFLSYIDRLLTTGTKSYAEEDQAGGVVVDVPVFYTCVGGSNDGLIAFLTSDCPGGTRTAPNISTITGEYVASPSNFRGLTRNSRFGSIMYERMRDCILTSTCEGQ